MKFVIIDESLMRSGYWVSVAGIDLSQFEKNPIMLFMHMRPADFNNSGANMVHAIGTWTNYQKETINGIAAITAEPVFDEKDEFALKIKQKVESGVYRMASAGLRVMSFSADSEWLRAGQTRETITNSILLEASIVDRGANDNAVKLYDDKGLELKLSDTPEININLKKVEIMNEKQLKEIVAILHLSDDFSFDDFKAKVLKLTQDATVNANQLVLLKTEKETAENELKDLKVNLQKEKLAAFSAKLDDKDLKLTEEAKANYLKMFAIDPEVATKAVELLPKFKSLADYADNRKAGDLDERSNLSFTELQKKHSSYLKQLKESDPETFSAKYKAEFGKDYKF